MNLVPIEKQLQNIFTQRMKENIALKYELETLIITVIVLNCARLTRIVFGRIKLN